MKPEERLRDYEKSVLDRYHESLPFWARPKDEAVYAALASFDSMTLPVMVASQRPINDGGMQHLRYMMDGFIYAIRFLNPMAAGGRVRPSSDQGLILEADDYLHHFSSYAIVADMHICFGRGLNTLEIDESMKRVRFVPKRDLPGSDIPPLPVIEGAAGLRRRVAAQDTDENVRTLAAALPHFQAIPHRLEAGRIVFENPGGIGTPEIDAFCETALPPETIVLPPETDLGGFTQVQFDAFWKALLKWSVSATSLFLEYAAYAGKPQHECMPTQVVTRTVFLDAVQRLSGLDAGTVAAILDRMTFGNRTSKPDVFLQPFICADDAVAWSPHVVEVSCRVRNMLKLMARTSELKGTADNLIGSQERSLARSLGMELAKRGYQYKLLTNLGEGKGEIDLLAYHTHMPTQALVIEGKGFLDTDEVNETHSATLEMISAQGQVRAAIDTLQGMTAEQKKALYRFVRWDLVKDFFGIVVTPNVNPHQSYDHSSIPAISLETWKSRLYDRDYRSPEKLWEKCREKRWLAGARNPVLRFQAIDIGGVRYEIPRLHDRISGQSESA